MIHPCEKCPMVIEWNDDRTRCYCRQWECPLFDTEHTAQETLESLRTCRKAAHITQAQLAAEIPGWTGSIVSAKENGKRGTWLHEVDMWRDALARLGG